MRFARGLKPDALSLVLFAVVGYLYFRPMANVSELERPAPELEAHLLTGEDVSLADYRGQVVVINFWATWCGFCKRELPDIQSFYEDYRGKGVELLTLSVDKQVEVVEHFMAESEYSFPVAMADAKMRRDFGGIETLPTTFIVDKKGQLRRKVQGQLYYGRLEELVEPLLAD